MYECCLTCGIHKLKAMSYTLIRHLRRTAVLTQQIRSETTMSILTQEDFGFRPPVAQWSKVIKEAEKIVGYPTSFMNLRWLLSDEFANLAMHLRKVVDTNHPIVKTVKTLLYNEHNNLQPWGLIILLLSKAVTSQQSSLNTSKIVENQRILAELTEMIRTGHYVHRGLLNIPPSERDNSDTAMFANKIAILIGDYLLVTANGMLARLKNQDLSYLISTALRDLSEGEFFGQRDTQNMPLPGKPSNTDDQYVINSDTLPLEVLNTLGSPVREWTLRTLYSGGSLFGRGCQGAVLLAGLSHEEQENAYKFGCHLCLAWQAAMEYQKMTSDNKDLFSLVSAPVLYALQENHDLYNVIQEAQNTSNVDFVQLKSEVLKTNAIEKTKSLYVENANQARSYIEMFGGGQSIDTIKQMINTL